MKYFFLVLAIIFAISTALLGVMFMEQRKTNGETAQLLLDNINERNALKTQLVDQDKFANPKAFPSRTTLEDWCKKNVKYTSNTSYSEDAVRLMNLAREDGYYLGLVGVELVSDNMDKPLAKISVYPNVDYSKFYVLNVAIVGESDIYIVEPATGTVVKSAEMRARFGWGVK